MKNKFNENKINDGLLSKLYYEGLLFDDLFGIRRGFFRSLVTLLYFLLKSFFSKQQSNIDLNINKDADILYFYQYENELRAIESHLKQNPSKAIIIKVCYIENKGLNWRRLNIKSILWLPQFIAKSVKENGSDAFKNYVRPYFAYNVYRYWKDILSDMLKSAIVATPNITNSLMLAINEAARYNNLKTAYIEHAITPKIYINFNLYDKIYINSNISFQNFIDMGYDPFSIILNDIQPKTILNNKSNTYKVIGVALNPSDNYKASIDLINNILSSGYKVLLRLHNSEKRNFIVFPVDANIRIQSASEVPLKFFFKSIDYCFAGNSSILYDLVMGGIPCAYFFDEIDIRMKDLYGIAKYFNLPIRYASDSSPILK